MQLVFYKKSKEERDLIKSKRLEEGIKEEKEHADLVKKIREQLKKYGTIKLTDNEIYEIIAKAHIKKDKDYYPKLKKYIEKDTHKSKEVVFNLFKSESKLDKLKRFLISLLEKKMKKSEDFNLGFFDLLKGRSYPIGTKREWKGKKFIKISKNKWRRFYEGDSRGQKQSLNYISKKILAAKTISELARIVFENRKRFVNEDGSVHKVVAQLLELAKSQKPTKKEEKKPGFTKVPDFSVSFGKKNKEETIKLEVETPKEEVKVIDKKEETYTPTPKEEKVIETESIAQEVKADKINEELKLGEVSAELRAGESYYNEKPSEILNTGKEVWGAARHHYDTYEVSSSNLKQMEEDGVAEKMITKSKLLTIPTLEGMDERIKEGQDGSKIFLENLVYKLLDSQPENNPEARQKYNEVCRDINRLLNQVGTGTELYVGLKSLLSPPPEVSDAKVEVVVGFGGSSDKITALKQTSKIVGSSLMAFLFPEDLRYEFHKMAREDKRASTKVVEYLLGKETPTEIEAKRILKGEKALLEAKGIKSIKKNDIVTLNKGFLEGMYRVQTVLKPGVNSDDFYNELASSKKEVETQIIKETDELINNWKKDNGKEYKEIMDQEKDGYLHSNIKWQNERYRKKDGSLTLRAIKKFGGESGFKEHINAVKRRSEEQSRRRILNRLNKPSEERQMSDRGRENYKSIKEKYYDYKQIKLLTNEVVVGKAGRDKITAVLKFEDGKMMEKSFSYEDIESVKSTGKTNKKNFNFYVETKAIREGGKTNYENKTANDLQKYLHTNYKIKSTTFGNSMPDSERQFHLRKTAESFDDLVDVLKIDKDIITANGKLGVSYGAFGGLSEKGALATYQPGQKIITLTRKKGYGSFGHEWGHFIDFMAGGGNSPSSSMGGKLIKVKEAPEKIPNGSRFTVKSKTRSGKEKEEVYFYDSAGNDRYPFINLKKGERVPGAKSSRYNFTSYSVNNLLSNDRATLQVPDKTDETLNKISSYQKEVTGIMQNIYDEAMSNIKKSEGENSLTFVMMAEKASYFKDPAECFARGFETYISDKFKKLGRKNTYLASIDKTKKSDGQYTYPQDTKLRKTVFDLYENIFNEIRNYPELKKSIDLIFGSKSKGIKLGFRI